MKVCVWSRASFEQTYASYHLIERILNALLDAGHEVYGIGATETCVKKLFRKKKRQL